MNEDSVNTIFNKFKFRKIRDPVHKFIEFDSSIWKIIDTEQFQRLRNIKQLGAAEYVFGGACHSRFEHSLGVAHLGGQQIDYLVERQGTQSLFENSADQERIKLCVQIAGLCHDLGHGPFSHMFDNILLPSLGSSWKHEIGSQKMLVNLFEENEIYQYFEEKQQNFDFGKQELDLVLSMIEGQSPVSNWYLDIIANKKNSIDVDKFDYVQRDCLHISLDGYQFSNSMLMMKEAKVIDEQICYPIKYHFLVQDLFYQRYKLYKEIYQHRVTQAIDLMFCDVFCESDCVFDFKNLVEDPTRLLHCTDMMIRDIESSQNPALAKAQLILKNIKTRNLYRYTGEITLDMGAEVNFKSLEELTISGTQFQKEDISIQASKIKYSDGDLRQIVKYYSAQNPDAICENTENFSLINPEIFGEKCLRLFLKKKSSQTDFLKLQDNFNKACKYQFNREASTIIKKYQAERTEKQISNFHDYESIKKIIKLN